MPGPAGAPVLASTAARQAGPRATVSRPAGTPLPTPSPAQAAHTPAGWVPALARCVPAPARCAPAQLDVPLLLLQQEARPAPPQPFSSRVRGDTQAVAQSLRVQSLDFWRASLCSDPPRDFLTCAAGFCFSHMSQVFMAKLQQISLPSQIPHWIGAIQTKSLSLMRSTSPQAGTCLQLGTAPAQAAGLPASGSAGGVHWAWGRSPEPCLHVPPAKPFGQEGPLRAPSPSRAGQAGQAGRSARLCCRPRSSLSLVTADQSRMGKMGFLKEGNSLPRGLMNMKGPTRVFLALWDSFLM